MTIGLRIVFFGSGAFGLPSLEALRRSSHELAAVVSLPDRPQGRRLELRPSPVKEWAVASGVPVIEYDRADADGFAKRAEALGADAFVVISFGAILPARVLSVPKKTSLNVHASLLPRYRGAAPIHWAILNGDAETGVSVMRMVEKLDAGDVLLQVKTPVLPEDDYVSLERRLAALGAEALTAALDLLAAGKAGFTPQDDAKSDYARKIAKDDGRIDWRRTADDTSRRVRAFAAWPTSYFFHEGKRFIVAGAEPARGKGKPGEVLEASAESGLVVACGEGALRVTRIQPEGKKPMPAGEFLRGTPLPPGRFLE
jgi:methionyl-tRNA formyltransferase